MISLLLVERFCALPLSSTDYGRVLMIVAVYFFYLGLMGLLGLWISALAKDSVHSLLLCLSARLFDPAKPLSPRGSERTQCLHSIP